MAREVKFRVEDSGRRPEGRDKNYWNLREIRGRSRSDGERVRAEEAEEKTLVFEDPRDRARLRSSAGEIYIDFDMEELKDISKEQKKTILRTLIDEDDRGGRSPGSGLSNTGFLPFIALLAFLAGIVTMFMIAGASGCCY